VERGKDKDIHVRLVDSKSITGEKRMIAQSQSWIHVFLDGQKKVQIMKENILFQDQAS